MSKTESDADVTLFIMQLQERDSYYQKLSNRKNQKYGNQNNFLSFLLDVDRMLKVVSIVPRHMLLQMPSSCAIRSKIRVRINPT